MDRLVDHLFVFEGNGVITDFPGNYAQYREQKDQLKTKPEESTVAQPSKDLSGQSGEQPVKAKRKMSFNEKREFEMLEKEIRSLNEEKSKITEELGRGNLLYEDLNRLSQRIVELGKSLDEKEMRWLELAEYGE